MCAVKRGLTVVHSGNRLHCSARLDCTVISAPKVRKAKTTWLPGILPHKNITVAAWTGKKQEHARLVDRFTPC